MEAITQSKPKKNRLLPTDHRKRWPSLLDWVNKGLSWAEAFRRTYPEVDPEKADYACVTLRNTKVFKKFALAVQPLKTSKMTKAQLLDHWVELAKFNVAEMFEDTGNKDGTVRLHHGWLEEAKRRNVIQKITVTKKTITTKGGDVITTETTDVTPYSRLVALSKLGKLLGYDKGSQAPAASQIQQNNNLYLVGQIEGIQNAIKQKMLPVNGRLPEAPVIDAEFVERMMKVEIVDEKKLAEEG